MNILFQGVFQETGSGIQVGDFLLCIGVSILIGLFIALVYTYKNTYTQSFILTLTLLPAVVCVVIMMVNGNVGAGVAVAGAFSLVRFRSAPGTAKEICAIFLAMGAGLITGMGYLGFGVLFTVILSLAMVLFTALGVGRKKTGKKMLHITIPENLDYEGVFDEILEKYTNKSELVTVKTSNLGSLYKLTYQVIMKPNQNEKKFLDDLRCRNGNLEIMLTRQEQSSMMEL